MPIRRITAGAVAATALLAAILFGAGATPAGAQERLALEGATKGVSVGRSPYRYATVSPGPGRGTILLRNAKRRGGQLSGWWRLPGAWFVPAAGYDGAGGDLAADGRTLLLVHDEAAYPPPATRLAAIDTGWLLRHRVPPGRQLPARAIRLLTVPGYQRQLALSPDGRTAYMTEYDARHTHFRIRSADLRERRLRRAPVPNANAPAEPLRGVPISQAYGSDGVAYTLYDGNGGRGGAPFVEVLDTAAGTASRLDLPGLERSHELFRLQLRLARHGRLLELSEGPARRGRAPKPVMTIDARRLLATAPVPPERRALIRETTAGHSREGRRIALLQVGDPALRSGRLLVFGCIHGDECGVATHVEPLHNGCPDQRADAFVVPNLNPDGTAAGTRVNARGVDLNRNFPASWRARGRRGDPEYPGPRPFSEPESRLAAQLVRQLRPRVTIWFHEDHAARAFVRAWGPSRAAARRFARLAGTPFRAIPWQAGTAPNWQNHRFPGSAAFVVELPRQGGGPSLERLDRAADRLAREAAED